MPDTVAKGWPKHRQVSGFMTQPVHAINCGEFYVVAGFILCRETRCIRSVVGIKLAGVALMNE